MPPRAADGSPRPTTLSARPPRAPLWAALPDRHQQRLLPTLTRARAQQLSRPPAPKEAGPEHR
jgi:hypothetical protein